MNSVGIDISKGRSTVAVMRPFGEVVISPFEVRHTDSELSELARQLKGLDGETRVVMEATGNYHAPVAKLLHDAGLYVSVVNAKLVHCYRQYRQYSKVQTVLKNNLISLLDTVFPNVNRLFSSPVRGDGSEKWVDFVAEFWHCRCVTEKSEKAFTNKYQRWCKTHGYNFSEAKAHTIHAKASGHIGIMPKSETTKLLVEQAVVQLRTTSTTLTALKREMLTLAAQLPEYPAVMGMFGVGPTLGPQLIAEIGDVRRFYSKKALVAYAGLDAPPNDSGDVTGKHKSMSKIGASSLRRTLFLVMSVYLQNAPLDEPIYQFMDRKRAEGKPYRVYMMASANKFLRIYYAAVKAYLESLEQV